MFTTPFGHFPDADATSKLFMWKGHNVPMTNGVNDLVLELQQIMDAKTRLNINLSYQVLQI
jgi:hypothetical protein